MYICSFWQIYFVPVNAFAAAVVYWSLLFGRPGFESPTRQICSHIMLSLNVVVVVVVGQTVGSFPAECWPTVCVSFVKALDHYSIFGTIFSMMHNKSSIWAI